MRERLAYVAAILVAIGVLVLSLWVWYGLDCQVIKDWNLNAPGRCIGGK